MKDFVFKGESHDFWEFLYVDNGTVSVCAGDTWMTLNTGDIICHQPNEFHAIKSIGKNSPNLIAISFVCNSPAMNFFVRKQYTLTAEEQFLISRIIDEARNTFSTPISLPSVEQVKIKPTTPFGSQQLILLYLKLFLISSIRNHPENAEKPVVCRKNTSEKKKARQTLLDRILEYMDFHLCEQLRISDICDAFSISRTSLQSLFHNAMGCGAIDYFNNKKIEQAKNLIREGNMNLTEISCFLSYSSLPYFSKQFKAATGMSPTEYASSVKGITDSLRERSSAPSQRPLL
jgi:AraC-like DNA-binding protein